MKMAQCKKTMLVWNKQCAAIEFLTAENVPPIDFQWQMKAVYEDDSIKFEAFMATKFHNIFLGTQPCQMVAGRNQCFGNYLCPHHQGCDVTGYPEHSLYIPARAQYSWLDPSQ
jgi:hypothetical protein